MERDDATVEPESPEKPLSDEVEFKVSVPVVMVSVPDPLSVPASVTLLATVGLFPNGKEHEL